MLIDTYGKCSEQTLDQTMAYIDSDKDGKVSWAELYKVVQ
jgi:Ca2+-binding EF-hand superfamily protein